MTGAQAANYVYAERMLLTAKENEEDTDEGCQVGDHVIVLYLELEADRPKSEAKAISLAQARQLRDDLTRLLEDG